jgi:adenosylhomocysteine nucleosidase
MLKILITCAVREEFFEIKWPDTEVYYVLTGIGKAKAAYRVAEAIIMFNLIWLLMQVLPVP